MGEYRLEVNVYFLKGLTLSLVYVHGPCMPSAVETADGETQMAGQCHADGARTSRGISTRLSL